MAEQKEGRRPIKRNDRIVDQLGAEISGQVGNSEESEIGIIQTGFDKTLNDALETFNSKQFDNEGFISKLQGIDLKNTSDKDSMQRILNNIKTEFNDVNAINNSDMMLRRDIQSICLQMPEMRDVVYVIRDSVIESDAVTGGVSRTVAFMSSEGKINEEHQPLIHKIEKKYGLELAIKNFIVPQTLMIGEMYVNIIPYKKLFAEIEAMAGKSQGTLGGQSLTQGNNLRLPQGAGAGVGMESKKTSLKHKAREILFTEGVDAKGKLHQWNCITELADGSLSLDTKENLQYLKESMAEDTKYEIDNISKITRQGDKKGINGGFVEGKDMEHHLKMMLSNIRVQSESTSTLLQEVGGEAMYELLKKEAGDDFLDNANGNKAFFENVMNSASMGLPKGNRKTNGLGDEEPPYEKYKDVKGCYIKYLDPLKVVPIRMDRKVIGYYYVTTSMDLQIKPNQPNGVVDLSFQHYAKDRNLVANLASIVIRSFDKPMLDKNVQLKEEISEIIMEHRFAESRLSFLFIPEDEMIRFVVNEDAYGKGHSVIEPALFPARMYLMLMLYNMLYTLNNTTTRVHYLRSSGMNKDYASQIQRAIRKIQSRRITIDDIYSYSGVLNKVGGLGEMVLPSGRGDFKALDTQTIPAVDNPVNIELLEVLRRQAVTGCGVPALLILDAIDQVDFAKTLELANTRFLSAVSNYKIDFNRFLTTFYQKILEYTSDLSENDINSLTFKFKNINQPLLDITNHMIQNFNAFVDLMASMYFLPEELEKDGKPTRIAIEFRRSVAEKYISQVNYEEMDNIVEKTKTRAAEEKVQGKANEIDIDDDDVEKVTGDKKGKLPNRQILPNP